MTDEAMSPLRRKHPVWAAGFPSCSGGTNAGCIDGQAGPAGADQ